ncbi:MAG: glycoside hydrolase family protein [Vulcanococcus sp.]|jgi:GH24 family phage-related lysozyme (muramidase)|uniref:glycoside hydrolase family protein n=1 Tax=Vulcanococcus sp. TaxID=2856995 RepID=UPI0025E14538|nr:glycoside hydrolase family protein [Vulcanococcus sp.]MBW0182069.1 glycoside hydrolase family protein [Vulcanococcus sp.]
MPLTPEGWTLLKTWEGCRLSAYPDPASGGAPWTIGYGHTGAEVVPGLTISQEQADAWLEQDAAEASGAVDRLLSGVALTPCQRDALISFCFNVGAGALERSTLRTRLMAGESAAVVIAQELPRWHKGPNGPVEGLKRRRAAEVAHAQAGSSSEPGSKAKAANREQATTPIQLLDAVQHHQGLAHQQEAWRLLQRSLTPEQLTAFAETFRRSATLQTVNGTGQAETAHGGLIQLPVPYLSQNDSATGQGSRMCFASTCAMAVAFLKPGCLSGSGQLDDQFLALVQRHGDTTDASAQVAALQSLGFHARFHTDGRIEHLVEQLNRGIPCPVGWLHRGPASAPSGGGHWSLVIGWDPDTRQLLMHDPNGEADLVNGGYVSTALGSGKALRYSERNWGRRWQVEGIGTGWWIQINPAS